MAQERLTRTTLPLDIVAEGIAKRIDKDAETFYEALKLPKDGAVLIITDAETNQDCIRRRWFATRLRDRIKPFFIIELPELVGLDWQIENELTQDRGDRIFAEKNRTVDTIGFKADDENLAVQKQTLEALEMLSQKNPANTPLTVVYVGKEFEGQEGIDAALTQYCQETEDTIHLFSAQSSLDLA